MKNSIWRIFIKASRPSLISINTLPNYPKK
jgi:hypothetical protein